MKSYKILTCLILTVIVLLGCEENSLQQEETKTTIVESYLFAGQIVDNVKVTQSFSYGQVEENIINIDDLDITISEGNTKVPLSSIGDGIYNNQNFIIESGKSYYLEFEREGEIISAETYVPENKIATISTTEVKMAKIQSGVFPGDLNIPDPVELSWENEEGDYYYIVIKNLEEDPEYVNENIVQFESQLSFVSEPQVTNFYAINARRELTQFGTYQITIFRVNPEYAALYESSGNSTLSLEEPPSNITNGLGIFTGVSSHTLYLEVIKK